MHGKIFVASVAPEMTMFALTEMNEARVYAEKNESVSHVGVIQVIVETLEL